MASLETTLLVDLLRGNPGAVAAIQALEEAGEPKCAAAPAISEMLVGAYRVGGRELQQAQALADSLIILEFDLEACHEVGRLGAALIARGEPMSSNDLLIAAISKRHGQRLITRDRGFSRIRGLSVETY